MDGFMCLYPMAQSNESLQLLNTKCCLVNLSSLISRMETNIVKFFAFFPAKADDRNVEHNILLYSRRES